MTGAQAIAALANGSPQAATALLKLFCKGPDAAWAIFVALDIEEIYGDAILSVLAKLPRTTGIRNEPAVPPRS